MQIDYYLSAVSLKAYIRMSIHDSLSLRARMAVRSVAACPRCAFVFLLLQFLPPLFALLLASTLLRVSFDPPFVPPCFLVLICFSTESDSVAPISYPSSVRESVANRLLFTKPQFVSISSKRTPLWGHRSLKICQKAASCLLFRRQSCWQHPPDF